MKQNKKTILIFFLILCSIVWVNKNKLFAYETIEHKIMTDISTYDTDATSTFPLNTKKLSSIYSESAKCTCYSMEKTCIGTTYEEKKINCRNNYPLILPGSYIISGNTINNGTSLLMKGYKNTDSDKINWITSGINNPESNVLGFKNNSNDIYLNGNMHLGGDIIMPNTHNKIQFTQNMSIEQNNNIVTIKGNNSNLIELNNTNNGIKINNSLEIINTLKTDSITFKTGDLKYCSTVTCPNNRRNHNENFISKK